MVSEGQGAWPLWRCYGLRRIQLRLPTQSSHGRADPQAVTPRSGSPTLRAGPLGPRLRLPFHDPYRQPWSLRGKGHGRFGAATDCGEPQPT